MILTLTALFIALTAARLALAADYAARCRRSPAAPDDATVTIVQAILSGDPRLESALQANLDNHPEAQFLWMIDGHDAEAQRIIARLAPAHPNLRAISCPEPRDGENPKLAKLILALPLVGTRRLIVLDDDTVLPAATAFPDAPLATALPIFSGARSVAERLTAGFVNGSALLTYLPAARLGLQRSINGMAYCVDAAQLQSLGGFAAAGHELTDDYAVARLYLRNGLRIEQSPAPVFVSVTIGSAAPYARIMRRWMIFANRYFRDNSSFATFFWFVLPGLLPLAGLIAAASSGYAAAWVALLCAKALANRLLLWRVTGFRSGLLDVLFEAGADLVTPLWAALACIRPDRLTWRSRTIELHSGAIRYR